MKPSEDLRFREWSNADRVDDYSAISGEPMTKHQRSRRTVAPRIYTPATTPLAFLADADDAAIIVDLGLFAVPLLADVVAGKIIHLLSTVDVSSFVMVGGDVEACPEAVKLMRILATFAPLVRIDRVSFLRKPTRRRLIDLAISARSSRVR